MCQCFCLTQSLSDCFTIDYEVYDVVNRAKDYISLPSITSYSRLRKALVDKIGLADSRVALGYRLSNENKSEALAKLDGASDLVRLVTRLKPFCTVQLTAAGKPSKRQPKRVMALVFDRNTTQAKEDDKEKGKVESDHISIPIIR